MRIGAALARMALAAGAASLPGGPVRTVFTGKGFHYVAAKLWAAGGQILFDGNGNLHGMSAGGGKPTKRLVSRNCKIDRSCQMSGFALSPNRKIAAVGVCDSGDPHVFGRIELATVDAARHSVQITTPPAPSRRF